MGWSNSNSSDGQHTILHLSDCQYGAHHRFGSDTPADTLLERLKEDLDLLKAEKSLRPDLIFFTGDLAEWGRQSEFSAAFGMLSALAEHLDLGRNRILVIPGNHDINRDHCEAYFLESKGSDRDPIPPYWPKWKLYADAFARFYQSIPSIEFTETRPWTTFEFSDLGIVAAGVNSTICESHCENHHFGYGSEDQYKWIANWLREYPADQWFRVACVHHNIERGCINDDENLKDADDFKRILSPVVDLALHGHTHSSQVGWMGNAIPILSTGSASLNRNSLPGEIPNQYQILTICDGMIRRYCRAYIPDLKRWGPDPRVCDDNGSVGQSIISLSKGRSTLISTRFRTTFVTQRAERVVPFPKIGAYQILGRLGSGRFGEVFRAVDRVGNQLAIKRFVPEKFDNRTVTEAFLRFKRGVQVLGSFSHPNVVRVHDSQLESPDDCHVVMDYIPNGNLRELLHASRFSDDTLPLERRVDIVVSIARAIDHIHSKDVIHRDIKPTNILVDVSKAGQLIPKLVDFDLVYLQFGTELTQGHAFGDQAFIPPEVRVALLSNALEKAPGNSPEPISAVLSERDPCIDVFALSGVLYFCVTYSYPPERPEQILEDFNREAKRIKDHELPLLEAMRAFLFDCLSFDQGRRPKSAAEVGLALELALSDPGQLYALHQPISVASLNHLTAEQTLRFSTGNPLCAIIDSTREAALVTDCEANALIFNRRFTEFFGIEGNLGKVISRETYENQLIACFQIGDFERDWERAISDARCQIDGEWGVSSPVERTVRGYSNPIFNSKGDAVSRLWMFEDITDKKVLETGLFQAQKMESIGRLASGIAHDFNNLLASISGNLLLLKINYDDEPESETSKLIQGAILGASRAADLVRELLGFSRRSLLEMKICNVNEVIESVRSLLSGIIGSSITVEIYPGDKLWLVRCDLTLLEQVFVNICLNARDAISGKGVITLKTTNIIVAPGEENFSKGAREGEFVSIAIVDNGSGMSEATRSRLFEPFFTTKDSGKGSGLGLATSYSIVEQHGGWIDVKSKLGEGSCFTVFLPRSEPPQSESSKCVGDNHTRELGLVLVVEDVGIVRKIEETILKRIGWSVMSAESGIDGLRILDRERERISVVLLDMSLPGMASVDVLREMKHSAPEIPIIATSGFIVDSATIEGECGVRPDAMLLKPFNIEEFEAIVTSTARPIA